MWRVFLFGSVSDRERGLGAAGSTRSAPTGRQVMRSAVRYGAGNVLVALARIAAVTVLASRHCRSCPAGKYPGSIGVQLDLKEPCWFTSTYSVVLFSCGSDRSTTSNSTRLYATPRPSAFTRRPPVWVFETVQVPE